jgi:hypothetical protein
MSSLDYSRVEIAAAAKQRLMSCTQVQRLGCNEVDVVRSARPKGERGWRLDRAKFQSILLCVI